MTVHFAEELLKAPPPPAPPAPTPPHGHLYLEAGEQSHEESINDGAVDLQGRGATSCTTLSKATGRDTCCLAATPSDVGRPCWDMRTGSRYEDVWTLPAAIGDAATGGIGIAKAQNHEYIQGRYGELIFNDTSISIADITVGAWVVRQRYGLPTPAAEGGGRGAAMSSSNAQLDAVWELAR